MGVEFYLKFLVKLFPEGPIWAGLLKQKYMESALFAISEELNTFEHFFKSVQDAFLLKEGNFSLLPKWEEFVGPLSPCVKLPSDENDRLKLVIAKLRARGDQRIEYYLSLIRAMGYEVSEVKHTPLQAGRQLGHRMRSSDDWFYTVIFKINPLSEEESEITLEVDENLRCAVNFYMSGHLSAVFQ